MNISESQFSHEKITRNSSYTADLLAEQMMHHFYKYGGNADMIDNTELKQRIENAWIQWKGVPYFPTSPMPVGVIGSPGQGKSTTMREASKIVAGLLGMKYTTNPSDAKRDPHNSLLCYSLAMSGEMSKTKLKGHLIPKEDKDSGEMIMSVARPDWERYIEQFPLSFVYLDDFMNTHLDVRTAGYDVLQPENDSDGVRPYISFTGNTGKDGAAAKKPSTAEFSRCWIVYQSDTAQEFCARAERKFNDEVGTCYVTDYLLQNPEKLNANLKEAVKHHINFACPRTWDRLIEQLRPLIHQYNYLSKNDPAYPFPMSDITRIAEDIVGFDSAHDFVTFVSEFRTSVEPLVKQIMADGEVSKEVSQKIDDLYNNSSTNAVHFKHSLALSIARNAVYMYTNAKDDAEKEMALQRFSVAMFNTIPDKEFLNFTSRNFTSLLISKTKDKDVGYIDKSGDVFISPKFKLSLITHALDQNNALASVDGVKLDRGMQTKDDVLFNTAFKDLLSVSVDKILSFYEEEKKMDEIKASSTAPKQRNPKPAAPEQGQNSKPIKQELPVTDNSSAADNDDKAVEPEPDAPNPGRILSMM